MGLIKDIQGRVDRYKEARRRIERGKRLVDLSKIVLVGDFYDSAVQPVLDNRRSFFAGYYRRFHEQQKDLLKVWIATDSIDSFPIPQNLAPEDCPHYSYRDIFGSDDGYIRHVSGHLAGSSKESDNYFFKAKKVHDFWVRRQSHYPAVHLGQALLSMEWELVTDIENREQMALWLDDGQTVVNFWEAVNALPDYSRHFENKPSFKDGRPDKKKGKRQKAANPAWDWVPQPQGAA